MRIRTGTRIIVDSAVNGRFSAVAAGDFDTDKVEISSIFAGTRKGAKVEMIIRETDDILNKYDKLASGL